MEAEEKKVVEHTPKEMPTVGELFQESWHVFRKSLLNLFLLNLIYWAVVAGIGIMTLILLVVFGAVGALSEHGGTESIDPSLLPVFIIGGIVFVIAVLFLVLLFNGLVQIGSIIAIQHAKERISIGEILQKGWRLLLPMLIVSIASFAMVFGGFFIFVIPGVLFSWYLAFVANEVVIGHERGMNALRASTYTVMKNFWEIALRVLPIVGIYFVMNMITSFVPMIAMVIDEDLGAMVNLLVNFGMIIPSILLQWYFMVYGIMLYKHAKARTGEHKYANIVWMWIVSGIGWLISILLIGLLITAVASGAFESEDTKYSNYNNIETKREYEGYYDTGSTVTPSETFAVVNTYRADEGLPRLQEDPMLCAYAQRRLLHFVNGYDNGRGFNDDRTNLTIVGSYFKDFIKIDEEYYDLTVPATAEDIVYFWADDGDERMPVNMKNYDAGCIRANNESMILIVGESR